MAKGIKCLWVGKLKSGFFREASRYYSRLIEKNFRLQESELRGAPSHLHPEERRERESSELSKRIDPGEQLICLDKEGSQPDSREFARLLQQWLESAYTPCFVLGGAYGVSRDLLSSASFCLSLSRMTLPHELCRVVFLEQLYRAITIIKGHPYHH